MGKEIFDDFLVKTGLYIPLEFKEEDSRELAGILAMRYLGDREQPYSYTFDGYCPFCKKQSVFTISVNCEYGAVSQITHLSGLQNQDRKIEAICSREKQHKILYWFITDDKTITKIGQYPNVKEILSDNIKKYRKTLNKDFIELQTAIQLHSNGVGIGAFVYLRRIFEILINHAFEMEKVEQVNMEDFTRMRMDDKIGIVKSVIPNFIVDHKSIYAILSKGIHELDENECLQFFPVLEESIEMILDEQLALQEKKAKENVLSKSIDSIKAIIKKS